MFQSKAAASPLLPMTSPTPPPEYYDDSRKPYYHRLPIDAPSKHAQSAVGAIACTLPTEISRKRKPDGLSLDYDCLQLQHSFTPAPLPTPELVSLHDADRWALATASPTPEAGVAAAPATPSTPRRRSRRAAAAAADSQTAAVLYAFEEPEEPESPPSKRSRKSPVSSPAPYSSPNGREPASMQATTPKLVLTGRAPQNATFCCEFCGKKYINRAPLITHRWEHHPSWVYAIQFGVPRRQQVQMMEAAHTLLSIQQPNAMLQDPFSYSSYDAQIVEITPTEPSACS